MRRTFEASILFPLPSVPILCLLTLRSFRIKFRFPLPHLSLFHCFGFISSQKLDTERRCLEYSIYDKDQRKATEQLAKLDAMRGDSTEELHARAVQAREARKEAELEVREAGGTEGEEGCGWQGERWAERDRENSE